MLYKKVYYWISVFLLPFIIFYYELILNVSTLRSFWGWHAVYILFFSVGIGLIGTLLSSISENRILNMIIRAVLIFLPVIPFLIEFFIYREFKVYYDLRTVLFAGADAAGGFREDIHLLIDCWDGISHIILYLLPTVLFLVWELCFDKERELSQEISPRKMVLHGLISIGAFLVAIGLITCNQPARDSFYNEYYFQTNVQNFGFIHGIYREVFRMATGRDKNVSFQTASIGDGVESWRDETIAVTTIDTEEIISKEMTEALDEEDTEEITTEEATVDPRTLLNEYIQATYKPEEYGYSALDINFTELAKTDTSFAELDAYIGSLTPSHKNPYTGIFEGKNLIMMSAEAFTAEVIDPVLTPTLYRLATKGINFNEYYQPATAGTIGGEFENLMGFLPTEGGESLYRTSRYNNYFTMGSQLNRKGYFGKAYHNNDYKYYSRDITHNNLGYSEGFMGYGNGMEQYVTPTWPESDLEMFEGTLNEYIDKQPFNIYYMTVSGHSNYGWSYNAMSEKNRDKVELLPYTNKVQAYLAANLELENALAYMVDLLEKKGIANDTVIVIGADHFPYGLDADDAYLGNMPFLSELYGYEVKDLFGRDHNRLIIWSGCLEDNDPIVVNAPTTSMDILPTLSNLFGLQWDSRLFVGRDVLSDADAIAFNMNYDWKTEMGTYISATATFTPNIPVIAIPDNYVEDMKKIVQNKVNYCRAYLNGDYFGHLYDLGLLPEKNK